MVSPYLTEIRVHCARVIKIGKRHNRCFIYGGILLFSLSWSGNSLLKNNLF